MIKNPSNRFGRRLADKAAIGLSLLCMVHCLLLPLAITLIPALLATNLGDERVHFWLVFVAVPISAFALWSGPKFQGKVRVVVLGLVGVSLLIGSAFWGEVLLGEAGERYTTVLATALIAIAHFKNYRASDAIETRRDHEGAACC
ncbi:MAG: MerC domain-containing protein [Pseudomonadota bacterium]